MLYTIRNAKVFVGSKLVEDRWRATVKSRYIHDAYKKFAELYRDQHNLSPHARVEVYGNVEVIDK